MVWILYGEARRWKVPPSELLGLEPGSYDAFCLNQAVNYLGSHIESELDKVGQKKDSKQRSNEAARQRRLEALLTPKGKERKGQYMDPAVIFNSR